jgi:hypothetical protein
MATEQTPITELDERYGEPGVPLTPWTTAEAEMTAAELWWLTTIRPHGGPHATPLLAVWDDGAQHVCTGSVEQKWRNLAGDPRCAVVTGRNDRDVGTDYVVEGIAERIVDDDRLGVLAAAWEGKYGAECRRRGAPPRAGPGPCPPLLRRRAPPRTSRDP